MTYSSSLAMSRSRFTVRNQNAVSFRVEERRLGPISNTITLIVLACLLGLLYLTQVTKANAFTYQISALQKQSEQLKAQHADLDVASARLQALPRVQASAAAKTLTPVSPSDTVQN